MSKREKGDPRLYGVHATAIGILTLMAYYFVVSPFLDQIGVENSLLRILASLTFMIIFAPALYVLLSALAKRPEGS